MNIILKPNNFPKEEGFYITKTKFSAKPEVAEVRRESNGKLYILWGNSGHYLENHDKDSLFSDEIFFGGEP